MIVRRITYRKVSGFMSLDPLWQRYQAAGYKGACSLPLSTALDYFYLAVLAFGEDDFAGAVAGAKQAVRLQPDSRLFSQSVTYLERVASQGKAGVYVDGSAFAAFIRGGGNVGLYAAASSALRAVYHEYPALSLLDIGVGDGLALLSALTDNVTPLDLIEPSAAMLAQTTSALDARGIRYQAANSTLQEFMSRQAGPWDVIQATWSLQSIPPAERPPVLSWMRQHGQRVLIAEFDVPDFAAMYGPDRVQYVAEHFERGLAEYEQDREGVAQGFLMPVMFGYFDRTAARTNWEGTIQGWVDTLRAAGFRQVQKRRLFAYFWADAYLIDAR